jgi:hypothetical protein
MHIVAIGWMYVVLMVAVVEAVSSNGTVLGAVFTFLLYGLLPMSIVLYVLGTPARKRALRAREAAAAAASAAPDGGGHAAAHTVTPVREEP